MNRSYVGVAGPRLALGARSALAALSLSHPARATSYRPARSGRVHVDDMRGSFSPLWMWVAGLAIVLWGIDLDAPVTLSNRVVLRALAVTLECAAAVLLTGRRRGPRYGLNSFYLGPWHILGFGVSMGLAAIAFRAPQRGVLAALDYSSVLRAQALLSVAVPVWTLGYLMGPGRLVLRLGNRIAVAAAPKRDLLHCRLAVLWVVFLASVAARITQIELGQFAYLADPAARAGGGAGYTYPLALTGALGSGALVIAAVEMIRNGNFAWRLTFLAQLAAQFVFGLLSGMKGQFAWTVLAVCAAVALTRGRIPVRWIVAGFVCLLLVVMPYNAAYRQLVRFQGEQLTATAAVHAMPEVMYTAVTGANANEDAVGETLADSSSRLSGRIRSVDSLAFVVQKTPEVVPYRSPLELISAPVLGLIPRALWPGKPTRNDGYDFGQQYYGYGSKVYTSAGIGPQADLYRYGGVLPLLIGTVLIGALCRLVDETLHPARDPRLVALYLSLFMLFIRFETSIVALMLSLPIKIGTMILLCRLVYRAPRPAAGAGQGQPANCRSRSRSSARAV